jgi:hypothetical protein
MQEGKEPQVTLGQVDSFSRPGSTDDIEPDPDSRDRFSGFRGGILGANIIAAVILCINIFITVFSDKKAKKYSQNVNVAGLEIYQGACDKAERWGSWIHLGINICSTLLLGASNYCMQIVVALTREQIDLAHSQGKSIDIAAPSLRNLKYIPRINLVIFWVLAFSSLPLHFIYNSAVYTSIGAHTYRWSLVGPEFLEGGRFSVDQANREGYLWLGHRKPNDTEKLQAWFEEDRQGTLSTPVTLGHSCAVCLFSGPAAAI